MMFVRRISNGAKRFSSWPPYFFTLQFARLGSRARMGPCSKTHVTQPCSMAPYSALSAKCLWTGARLQLKRFELCTPLLVRSTGACIVRAPVLVWPAAEDGCGVGACTSARKSRI